MSDLAWSYDPDTMTADLAIDALGSPATSDDLETAIILSLGTDARALSDDILPDDSGDRRGWCGDASPPEGLSADTYGSRLWLLSREKQVPSVLARARTYAREALEWMVSDGIAERVEVAASFPVPGVLEFVIDIYRPASPAISFRYAVAWQAQAARSAA